MSLAIRTDLFPRPRFRLQGPAGMPVLRPTVTYPSDGGLRSCM
jgi:hypothetical protein